MLTGKCKEKTNMKNKLKYEGLKTLSKEGYLMEVIEYKGYYNCIIKLFLDTENFILLEKPLKLFKNKSIRNPYHPSVQGVGYIGVGIYKPSYKNKDTKEYTAWSCMLRRCYGSNKQNLSYKDVTVCDDWHNFQNFAKWYQENYNSKTMQGWQLDKDTICPECKIYSPKTCAFVPREINNITKGSGKLCVRKNHNKYLAYMSQDNKHKHIGSFSTEHEAYEAFKEEKIKYITLKLLPYRDKIDIRVVDSLLNLQYLRVAEKSAQKK